MAGGIHMSVAGDIIDDLEISAKFRTGAITGLCGAAAVCVFVTIGMASSYNADHEITVKSEHSTLTKTEALYAGGAPRPR